MDGWDESGGSLPDFKILESDHEIVKRSKGSGIQGLGYLARGVVEENRDEKDRHE